MVRLTCMARDGKAYEHPRVLAVKIRVLQGMSRQTDGTTWSKASTLHAHLVAQWPCPFASLGNHIEHRVKLVERKVRHADEATETGAHETFHRSPRCRHRHIGRNGVAIGVAGGALGERDPGMTQRNWCMQEVQVEVLELRERRSDVLVSECAVCGSRCEHAVCGSMRATESSTHVCLQEHVAVWRFAERTGMKCDHWPGRMADASGVCMSSLKLKSWPQSST
jgi:hypothetical protein